MTLEEIRKNLKVFKECALRQVEAAVENWVEDYCGNENPDFRDINSETIKKALLKDEDLMFEIVDAVVTLVQIKMIND